MKIFILTTYLLSSYSHGWYCESYGTDGANGWGEHWNRATAAQIAFNNCEARSFGWCSIPTCY